MKQFKKTVFQRCIPYLRTVFLMFTGVACGLLLADCMQDMGVLHTTDGKMLIIMLILLISIYLALFLQIIIHESGHLLFGLLTGYMFSSFRIGSFMFVKKNGKLHFSRMSLLGTGGQCLMDPPDLKDGAIPYKLYNLGGAILNFLSAVLFAVGAAVMSNHPLIYTFLMLLTLFGFVYAMLNAVPMHMGTVDNDGMNTLAMSKDPEALRAFWLQLKMNQAQTHGIRLKDMPEEWFRIPPEESMHNPIIASIGVFACSRLMDEHRFEEADALMKHLLCMDTGIAGIYQHSMICDRIYCELVGPNRSFMIMNLLSHEQKKFMNSMKDSPSILRTAYADALLHQKDFERAAELKEDFEKSLKTHPYEADIQSERELVALCEQIETKRGTYS